MAYKLGRWDICGDLDPEQMPLCPGCDQPIWVAEVRAGLCSIGILGDGSEATAVLIHRDCFSKDEQP